MLAAVASLVDSDDGWPTTLRDIGEVVDIGSTNGVREVVLALERMGLVERRSMQAGVRPSPAGRRLLAASSDHSAGRPTSGPQGPPGSSAAASAAITAGVSPGSSADATARASRRP